METERSTPRLSEFWNNNVDSSFADNSWQMRDSWWSHISHLVCSLATLLKKHMQALVAMCALWASFACLHYDMRNTFNRACLTNPVEASCKNNSLQYLSMHVFSLGCSLAPSVEARRPWQWEWRQQANIKNTQQKLRHRAETLAQDSKALHPMGFLSPVHFKAERSVAY